MAIISSGYGYFVIVIGGLSAVLTQIFTDAIFHDRHFYEKHGWPKLLALWIAAAIVWPLGRDLNKQKQKFYFDPWNWGESLSNLEGNNGVRHALFFISMEYWAIVLVVLGIIFLFVTD